MWSAPKQPTERCGHKQSKPRGQAMWSKAFESMEENSHLEGFSSSAGVSEIADAFFDEKLFGNLQEIPKTYCGFRKNML